MTGEPRSTISAIVCAYNEAAYLPACLHALLAQTRQPDEILVIDNASSDGTGDLARGVAGVRVIHEPVQGLVVARETARVAARGDILAYVDADCRPPIGWLESIERRFDERPAVIVLVAPATHRFVHHGLRIGAILYGGNFAVRRDALARINGFDRSIEFHGEDTNLGRRLTPVVIAITDHILMKRDLFKRAGRLMSLGRKHFSGERRRGADAVPEMDHGLPDDRWRPVTGE